MNLKVSFTAAILSMLGCTQTPDEGRTVLSEGEVRDLIDKGVLCSQINFTVSRIGTGQSSRRIDCHLILKNFGQTDIRFMSDWFSGAYKYSLIGSDGNQIACVDGPPPGISSLEETFVPRGGSWSTSVNYESFECFHATTDDAGVTRYDLPGTFRFYHEAFPSDVLEFSIDSVGDLRPRLDMRLQDGIESGP